MRSLIESMKSRCIIVIAILTLLIPHSPHFVAQAQSDQPIVRAVLFYSPTCGHCQLVIRDAILPLIEQHGEQFQIIGVDTSQPQGAAFYDAAREMFKLEFRGVPFLVIGNEYLSGSVQIPEELPGTIEKYMAQGGVDWPNIPGLVDAIHASETAQAPTPEPNNPTPSAVSLPTRTPDPIILEPAPSPNNNFSITNEIELTVWQRVMLDPLGNGLAIIVLITMIATFIGTIFAFRHAPVKSPVKTSQIVIPILCLIGLGVAGYLAYVEITQTAAVCGPVGDCNTVQQSEYARLFGILPIGVLGIMGYLAILTSWGMTRLINQHIVNLARLAMFFLSTIGIIFSIYLTFLEPFVIGATCAWCVTSAILMTALFALTLKDGKFGYQQFTLHKIKPPML